MEKLLKLIYEHPLKSWSEDADTAFKELFGGETGRYPERAGKSDANTRAEILGRH